MYISDLIEKLKLIRDNVIDSVNLTEIHIVTSPIAGEGLRIIGLLPDKRYECYHFFKSAEIINTIS
jgi:hypothetical protein